ncbi:uncharacterized protein [Paramormyrops kingsleyae]|uniref:uncharacterized protein n=1 Tax=Paramormyrops kingsleyae TaxID=1676925 RepID=UPI003B971959
MTTFTSDLTDKNSMVYKVLETTVVTELSKIFEKQYGDIFIGVIILQFRPGSVFVDSEVKLNTSASISPSSGFPTPKDLKEVLVEAITNNTISSFNISVESISSQVLIQTTLQPSTGRTTTVSLSTKKSNIATIVRRNDSTVTASTSTASLPTTTSLTTTARLQFSKSQTFVQELNNNSSLPNSSEMTTASTPKTEAAATKNTLSTTIAKMVATREMKTTPTEIAATAVKTTSSTTNAAVRPEKVLLVFAIMTTFTSDLTDKNSMVYKVLETAVVTELSKIFEKQYGDIFIGVIILQFRPGSVFVDSEVKLNTSASISPSSGFPTPKDLKEVLVEAITSNTISSFNISVESISTQAQ